MIDGPRMEGLAGRLAATTGRRRMLAGLGALALGGAAALAAGRPADAGENERDRNCKRRCERRCENRDNPRECREDCRDRRCRRNDD